MTSFLSTDAPSQFPPGENKGQKIEKIERQDRMENWRKEGTKKAHQ